MRLESAQVKGTKFKQSHQAVLWHFFGNLHKHVVCQDLLDLIDQAQPASSRVQATQAVPLTCTRTFYQETRTEMRRCEQLWNKVNHLQGSFVSTAPRQEK